MALRLLSAGRRDAYYLALVPVSENIQHACRTDAHVSNTRFDFAEDHLFVRYLCAVKCEHTNILVDKGADKVLVAPLWKSVTLIDGETRCTNAWRPVGCRWEWIHQS